MKSKINPNTLKVLKIIGIVIICYIIFRNIFLFILFSQDSNKFDYDSSKKMAIKYLNDNKEELENIGNELYNNKSSMKNPFNKINYASYIESYQDEYEKEYVKFDMDAQGMLGGQYYGLIYSVNDINDNEKIKIYDELKEKGTGNNIFIREKISDNWYFYYDDYDGKVNVENIK